MMIFAQIIEEVRWMLERRSKEQQLRGLQRTTGHLGIPEPPTKRDDSYTEPHKIPVRTKPAPKKGRYDTHPGKVRIAKSIEKEVAGKMAKGATTGTSLRSANSDAAKAIRALRSKRDEPLAKKSRIDVRKATAARRLPIKFPKDRR